MSDPFEGWAIVELMGHRRLSGHVSEQEIAGAAFLRLDVHTSKPSHPPETHGEGYAAEFGHEPPPRRGQPAVTQFYSASAVYCITPTTEDIARKLGDRLQPAPVSRYELAPPHRPDDEPDLHDDGVYREGLPF